MGCACVCVCVPSEHTQADDSQAVPRVTSPPGHSGTVPLLTGTLQWVSRLDPGVAVRPGWLQGHRSQAQVKLEGGESEAPGRVRKSSGEGPLSWESLGRRLWWLWACTPPWAVSLPPGGATGLTALAQLLPPPAPPHRHPRACWPTQLRAPIYGHSRRHSCLGSSGFPLPSVGWRPPGPFDPAQGAVDRRGGTRRWPGDIQHARALWVTAPRVSGGRSSEEAGRGCLPRLACPSFFSPTGGPAFLLSIRPSLPHPSVHSSSSFRVSGDPPPGPQAPTPPHSHPSSHLYPFQHNPAQLGPSLRGHMVRLLWSRVLRSGEERQRRPQRIVGPGRWSPLGGQWRLGQVWDSELGQGTVGQRGVPGGGDVPFIGEGQPLGLGTTPPEGVSRQGVTGCVGPTEPNASPAILSVSCPATYPSSG